MEYTAIIKDGGLFIPNVMSDLSETHMPTVKVTLDITELHKHLNLTVDSPSKADDALVNDEQQKFDLGTIHIKAFDNVENPVEWQNGQCQSESLDAQVELPNVNNETSKQVKILSFAGSWQELDEDILSSDSIEQRRLESLKERNT